MPREKQRTPKLRAQLLVAAEELLGVGGPTALTVRALADRTGTSTAAVYELLGDKRGVVRELYFEGFRRMAAAFAEVPVSAAPDAQLWALVMAYRHFALAHPHLVEVMFARPFSEFEARSGELQRVQACYVAVMSAVEGAIEAGLVDGDPLDVAHVLMATCQGLTAAELAQRLGTAVADRDRRYRLAFTALLRGLRPNPTAPAGKASRRAKRKET